MPRSHSHSPSHSPVSPRHPQHPNPSNHHHQLHVRELSIQRAIATRVAEAQHPHPPQHQPQPHQSRRPSRDKHQQNNKSQEKQRRRSGHSQSPQPPQVPFPHEDSVRGHRSSHRHQNLEKFLAEQHLVREDVYNENEVGVEREQEQHHLPPVIMMPPPQIPMAAQVKSRSKSKTRSGSPTHVIPPPLPPPPSKLAAFFPTAMSPIAPHERKFQDDQNDEGSPEDRVHISNDKEEHQRNLKRPSSHSMRKSRLDQNNEQMTMPTPTRMKAGCMEIDDGETCPAGASFRKSNQPQHSRSPTPRRQLPVKSVDSNEESINVLVPDRDKLAEESEDEGAAEVGSFHSRASRFSQDSELGGPLNNNNNNHPQSQQHPKDVLPLPIEIPESVADIQAFRRYLSNQTSPSYESLGGGSSARRAGGGGRRSQPGAAVGLTPTPSRAHLGHEVSKRTASLSHAIMTLALLSASICQLKFLITYSHAHSYPVLNYFLIFTSIILEIGAGIGYVMISRCSFDNERIEAIHNYLIFALFIVAVSNVVLAAFAFDSHICGEVKKQENLVMSLNNRQNFNQRHNNLQQDYNSVNGKPNKSNKFASAFRTGIEDQNQNQEDAPAIDNNNNIHPRYKALER